MRTGRRHSFGIAAGALLLVISVAALVAPAIAPYGVNELVGVPLQGPSTANVLGTDEIGRDLLTRVLFGARASLVVGFGAAATGTLIGSAIGLFGGYVRGYADAVLQRLMETVMSFPLLVAALAILSTVDRPSIGLVVLSIGAVIVPRVARVIRGVVLALREQEFVLAARAVGGSGARIVVRHLAPNVLPYAIVLFSILFGNAILAEAALSFLGYGVQPPTPSWGGMLGGAARVYMFKDPWLVVPPGAALSLTVFAANIFGDTLRDILDPKMTAP